MNKAQLKFMRVKDFISIEVRLEQEGSGRVGERRCWFSFLVAVLGSVFSCG